MEAHHPRGCWTPFSPMAPSLRRKRFYSSMEIRLTEVHTCAVGKHRNDRRPPSLPLRGSGRTRCHLTVCRVVSFVRGIRILTMCGAVRTHRIRWRSFERQRRPESWPLSVPARDPHVSTPLPGTCQVRGGWRLLLLLPLVVVAGSLVPVSSIYLSSGSAPFFLMAPAPACMWGGYQAGASTSTHHT